MAIKIQGSTIIDDSRNVVNASNIGIGTTNPTVELDVDGDVNISGIATITGGIDAIGIQSGGVNIADGVITALNFVGAGNTFALNGSVVDISIEVQDPTIRTTNRFVATASQSSFTVSYSVGYVDVFLNGSKLDSTEYTATNGTSVSLTTAAAEDDIVEIVAYESVGITEFDIINDTNPQLGGNLDLNSKNITGTGNLNITGIVTATSFVKDGGTSSQFLKADGSVDSSTYLTSYTESQTLNDVLGLGNTSSTGLSVGIVTATSFVKDGGTSSQFLKADGSVDSSTYLTSYTESQALDDVVGLGSDTTQTITVGTATTGIILRPDGTLNVSGASTFSGDVSFGSTATFGDNDKLKFGDSNDLEIYHDGNHSYIDETGTGQLIVKTSQFIVRNPSNADILNGVSGGSVELYYSDDKKFETTGAGVSVFGTLETQQLNVSGVSTFSDDLIVGTATTGVAIRTDGTLNVTGVSTFSGDVSFGSTATFGDNDRLKFGDGDDLEIYHDGNQSYISDQGSGSLRLLSNQLRIRDDQDNAELAKFLAGGRVELYYDNSKKFETTGVGVSIVNGTSDTATIYGPSNLIIDPMPVGVGTTSGVVRIKGDLFVDGTTTQINSTTLEIADFVVGIASTATTDLLADGAGIGIGSDKTFLYEHNGGTNPSLQSSENLSVATGKVYQIGTTERLSADTLSLGTGTTIHSPASNRLIFGTNGQERVRINASGKVGIGSDTPTQELHVEGNALVNGNLYLNDTNYLSSLPTGDYGSVQINGSGVNNWEGYSIDGLSVFMDNGTSNFGLYDDVNNHWAIRHARGSNSFTELFGGNNSVNLSVRGTDVRVENVPLIGGGRTTLTGTASQNLQFDGGAYFSGNLGVGNTNPTAKLDVDGNANISGITTATSFSGELHTTSLLKEEVNIVNNKLSEQTNIDTANGMVHFFTTTETTTSTPNIRYDASNTLNSKMNIGETIAVSIITTCAAAGYSTAISIDGVNQTVKWNGGSLPSTGGSSGNDIYSFQTLKTADATYTVFGTLTNFAAG